MSLREKFAKFMDEYTDVYETVKKTQNFKHPFGSFIRQDIVNEIMPFIDKNNYSVKGSCGAGRYTTVPWIAVFDKRITTSAQKGVYIVYLLNKDTKELFLTLNQGATDVSQSDKTGTDGKLTFTGVSGALNSKTLDILHDRAADIRNKIIVSKNQFNDDIRCGSPGYDAGAIFCKKYTLTNLPDDKQLNNDLNEFIQLYKKYYESIFNNTNSIDSTENDFNLWMKWQHQRNSPTSLYKQVTIDSMISILKRGSKAFDNNDNSVINCFDIDNSNDFKVFYAKFYQKATQLDKKYGHSDFRNALDFYNKFLKVRSLNGVDYNKIEAIVSAYEKNFDIIFEGEKYKIDALEQFNKHWDINASDFSAMLENAFSKCANLLTSGNYFAYRGIVEFAQAKPEIVRALFKRLCNNAEDFVSCANEFKTQSAEYFDSIGKSTYQDLHAVSVYCFFLYPHKYCIYKSSFYNDFAKIISFNPEKISDDYNTNRIKNNEALFEAVKYVLSVYSQTLLEKLAQKEKQCNLDNISLNYWAFDVIHSIRYGFIDLSYKKIGAFDSWEIIDENTAIKTCDKSFFEYKGSGVPKEICWFFDAENIPKGSSKTINLLFGGNSGKNYKGVLKNDSTDRRRIQIRWNSDLGELFEQFKDLNAKAKFVKTDVDTYEIYMCVEKDDAEKDAWLLAWNPNSWEWEDLKEACELTRNGNVYNITWSCASNSVKVGDRVYIIVLGTTENGIIASGHAISEQYEYEHWNEQKRADGKKNKGIDIELEYIIDPESDAPLAQSFLKKNFPEQHWSPQASGISIKEQYVNNLYDEWLKHVSKIQGGEKEMTTKEKINAIKSYIAARGFNYEGDLIENFYLSLKSKPFVILAGTSGTGKTRLVKLFAEAIGAEMQLVPVRPDWSDSSDLFGHLDLNGDFKKGAIIDFVKDASDHLTKPYFLCFDEMNLARVEHYMSDILSVIETRDFDENKKRITTSPLIEKDFCRCSNGRNEYGELCIPENLYIIGTVNMDETTFPFSKKVLDRANTIEFSFVDLMSKPVRFEAIPQKLNEDNSFLKTEYLYLLDCDDGKIIDTVCFNLEELNQILVKANLHVGYRVRDEILFYMMNNKKAGLLSEEAAFDHEIMQKILPRVQGSSAAIKDVLSELFVKCAGDFSGFSGVSTFEQMNTYIDQKDCKYPNSAKKIAFMMRRYEEDGFTSYWL